jgi:integrase
MRAWLFQDTRQRQQLGDKCPWSVGWYSADGKKKSKKVGSKSMADKFRQKVQGELAAGICTVGRTRTPWATFRREFIDVALAGKAETTKVEYESALATFERIASPTYVDAVTTATVDKFIAKRQAEPANAPIRAKAGEKPTPKAAKAKPRTVSPATVNKELRHLRAAFRKARKWGLLAQAPDVTMLREPDRDPYFVDDATFKALYDACGAMTRPEGRRYPAADWWRALLAFAYMTGWRIGEILDLRRDDVNLETGIATVDAENTKGRREARVELHPIVVDHLRAIVEFQPLVFDWPHHERTLWADFKSLKSAAGVDFPGAFHRLRFGFCNANVDNLDADLLQRLMRHRAAATTRKYVNAAERMKRAGTAAKLHVPDVLRKAEAV